LSVTVKHRPTIVRGARGGDDSDIHGYAGNRLEPQPP
jgi:hypothetical protein